MSAGERQPRITIVGAGGSLFPLRLIKDVVAFESLRDCSIRLYDIDPERADRTAVAANELFERHAIGAQVSVVQERRSALADAQFVICVFQVGGFDAYRLDVEIPREFGVDQPVGDTLGAGGVFRGLRTIAALKDLVADMRRACPDALLIQFANPMAPNCWATRRLGAETIGLCHSVQHTSQMLADELDVPYDEITFDCAGVNHTAWFTTFRRGDEDLLPAIRSTMSERHLAPNSAGGAGQNASAYEGADERVRAELMRLTGFFHTESSHHASEYWPWFRKSPELVDRYIATRWDFLEQSLQRENDAAAAQLLAGPLTPSEEYCGPIIDSCVTGKRRVIYGNVHNGGLISNLPHDACVELACLIDRSGVRPVAYGALPASCAALNMVQINLHRLIVEAALSGNKRLVHVAVALDPLTSSILTLPAIREMTDRMLEAEAEWLPQFSRSTTTVP